MYVKIKQDYTGTDGHVQNTRICSHMQIHNNNFYWQNQVEEQLHSKLKWEGMLAPQWRKDCAKYMQYRICGRTMFISALHAIPYKGGQSSAYIQDVKGKDSTIAKYLYSMSLCRLASKCGAWFTVVECIAVTVVTPLCIDSKIYTSHHSKGLLTKCQDAIGQVAIISL